MSRRHLALLGLTLVLAASLAAAPSAPSSGAQARLSYDVHFLASGALEGRFSGSEGAKVAAEFIADRFRDLGLRPASEDGGYFQHFSFIARVHPGPGNALAFAFPGATRTAKVEEDFRPLSFSSSGTASGEVVFAGYGIHAPDLRYDDYAGLDVKGKVVLVMRFSPDGDDPASKFQPHMALRRKASEARAQGAVALLVATGPVGATETVPVKISFDASFADSGLPVLGISTPLAEALFAGHGFTLAELQQRMNERKEPASRPLGVNAVLTADVVQERADAVNVVGLLPGSDPGLSGEAVVVGAHYDHLGYGGEGSGSLAPDVHAVHPGADDNASGTAGMLEIARRMVAARPERTLVFAAFSGEEEGLLGSSHFVQNPPLPREKIVAMLNLDMVGRPKPGPALTIGGYGTAAQWPGLVETLNKNHHLKLSTNKGGFGASDHSSFYAADIPVLFFFTGAHEDYHKPSDTADRLDYRRMAEVVGFAADLSLQVADLAQRPTFQKVADEGTGERRSFKVRTGVIPEFGYEGSGVKLSGVRGGSPADRAGLKAGDIVVQFGPREIRNIYDYMYALGDHKAGETVVLKVKRGNETLELPVTLEAGGAGGR
ncbi:MAG TPA: M20/M25/M40 family metallo-hydrolase [Thermoanaerobaculaceae bacterium]|nr:M20/M25/M40 family metallo-hydrolase [Thermoanaerobaculaceae bacterium]